MTKKGRVSGWNVERETKYVQEIILKFRTKEKMTGMLEKVVSGEALIRKKQNFAMTKSNLFLKASVKLDLRIYAGTSSKDE